MSSYTELHPELHPEGRQMKCGTPRICEIPHSNTCRRRDSNPYGVAPNGF